MDTPASLDIVEAAVRTELSVQERRADAADTRTGVVLGFAGLVVSVGVDGLWPPVTVVVRLLAGAAALVALGTLTLHATSQLSAKSLHERYLTAHPVRTRLALLDNDIVACAVLHTRVDRKVARLRLASRLVLAALALAVLAGTVETIT